jgi:hypothetical protein
LADVPASSWDEHLDASVDELKFTRERLNGRTVYGFVDPVRERIARHLGLPIIGKKRVIDAFLGVQPTDTTHTW